MCTLTVSLVGLPFPNFWFDAARGNPSPGALRGRGRGRGAVAVLPGPGCRFPRGYGALAALPRPVGRGLVASWPRRPWCSGGLISRGPRGRGALATLPGPVGRGRGRREPPENHGLMGHDQPPEQRPPVPDKTATAPRPRPRPRRAPGARLPLPATKQNLGNYIPTKDTVKVHILQLAA
ncbi:hypothetical protein Tco_0229609 [Tanacetum coccineum]